MVEQLSAVIPAQAGIQPENFNGYLCQAMAKSVFWLVSNQTWLTTYCLPLDSRLRGNDGGFGFRLIRP
jgi:hypothetical protein